MEPRDDPQGAKKKEVKIPEGSGPKKPFKKKEKEKPSNCIHHFFTCPHGFFDGGPENILCTGKCRMPEQLLCEKPKEICFEQAVKKLMKNRTESEPGVIRDPTMLCQRMVDLLPIQYFLPDNKVFSWPTLQGESESDSSDTTTSSDDKQDLNSPTASKTSSQENLSFQTMTLFQGGFLIDQMIDIVGNPGTETSKVRQLMIPLREFHVLMESQFAILKEQEYQEFYTYYHQFERDIKKLMKDSRMKWQRERKNTWENAQASAMIGQKPSKHASD